MLKFQVLKLNKKIQKHILKSLLSENIIGYVNKFNYFFNKLVKLNFIFG